MSNLKMIKEFGLSKEINENDYRFFILSFCEHNTIHNRQKFVRINIDNEEVDILTLFCQLFGFDKSKTHCKVTFLS